MRAALAVEAGKPLRGLTDLRGNYNTEMSKVILSCLALLAGFFSLPVELAAQWSQWRGDSRQGLIGPTRWPATFEPAWSIEVGEGYSSPVVAGDLAFVHSRHDPAELVTAVDAGSGRVVWQQRYDAPYGKNSYATSMGKGPNATPLVAEGKLFTLGATGVLTAWDAETGRHLWRKDFSRVVDLSKLFCGTAASPLLADGALVVQVGSDVHGGSIIALDPASGQARWEWRGQGPGYASPVRVDIDGVPQIVSMTNRSVVGVDLRTGKGLWSFDFLNEWHENIVTPVWTGHAIVVSSKEQGTVAIRPTRAGDAWSVREAWRTRETTMYMTSPVVGDGVIYGMTDKRRGAFVALDAATGAPIWQSTGREAAFATVWLTPTDAVFVTDAGRLVAVARGRREFAVSHRVELGVEGLWTGPAFLGPDLIVKDASHLRRLRGQ